MRCYTILEKYLHPIRIGIGAKERPPIIENKEPLIEMSPIGNRLFIRSNYFEQGIPNSLKSIYLRQCAVERLLEALSYLPEKYSFILYDGFRPLQVQSYLFEQIQQNLQLTYPNWSFEEVQQETLKYVAFPSIEEGYPAPHLTGGAIDLTLGDEAGNPRDLGTDFDEMNAKSATVYFENHPFENEEAYKNRRLLFHSMTQAGFQNYEEEWWHYDFGNVTWAKKANAQAAIYGPIIATIKQHEVKGYQFK